MLCLRPACSRIVVSRPVSIFTKPTPIFYFSVQNKLRFHTGFGNKHTAVCVADVNVPFPRIIRQLRQFQTSSFLYADEAQVVKTPQFPESVSEGDVRWIVAVGDTVREDETLCEIDTDKTAIVVPAPFSGVVEKLLVEEGGRVETGFELCHLRPSDGSPAPAKPKEEPAAAPATEAPPPPPTPAPAAPPAPGAGPIPSQPPPVPPMPKGPISSTPVADFKPFKPTPVTPAAAAAAAVEQPAPLQDRSEQRVKMNRMRQRIAQRLKEAQNTCAMLTTFNEVDMSNILALRSQYKEEFLKKHGIKLGFMSAFLKASAYALRDQPVVNAVIDDKEIVYRNYVDISVAVATPKGLVVPVLRNVDSLNFAGIERELYALGEKPAMVVGFHTQAKAGTLAIEDMDGGTFTISNGGVFGSMFGTPIINPPQSAILGMHAINWRPVVVGSEKRIEPRPMMYVALTYDHRLVDGREAVLFLRKIKSVVEDPRILFLDL